MNAPSRKSGATVFERNKGCENKVRYTDNMAARAAAQYDEDRDRELRTRYIYPCKFCGGWHVTKSKKSDWFRAYPKQLP